MRKFFAVLLCALILGETGLLYSANRRYENLAAEKSAVERRADVLKTLWDQTERELTEEKERWQAEKRAILAANQETKQEAAAPPAEESMPPAELTGWLQDVSGQLGAGAEAAREKWRAVFQGHAPENTPAVQPAAAAETSVPPSPRMLPEAPGGNDSGQAQWK